MRAMVGIADDRSSELHKVKSTPDDIRRFGFGEAPAFEALIAEIDGRFAGCCLFFASFSTWRGRPGVYVQDLLRRPMNSAAGCRREDCCSGWPR